MDVLKKIFDINKCGGNESAGDNGMFQPRGQRAFGNEFRKPIWIDDCESDDELFGNRQNGANEKAWAQFQQVFTNPLEMQRHFEQQIDEVMSALQQFDDPSAGQFDANIRAKYLKPGFEDLFGTDTNDAQAYAAPAPSPSDSDLDGEIYADQLHSLLQRITPDLEAFAGRRRVPPMAQSTGAAATAAAPSDEQRVWNLLHGTASLAVPDAPKRQRVSGSQLFGGKSSSTVQPQQPTAAVRSGIFEGAFQGPKVFRQSIVTQTIRRPDGSTETRQTIRDADGSSTTTVTRTTADGRTLEHSAGRGSPDAFGAKPPPPPGERPAAAGDSVSATVALADRNIYVTKEGYAMPMNIW